ncbi:hypothetical protein WA1_04905 [Scytonema hofmannii PCC 7110]|uniref:Uncharacterized protein n=1 Tax=Scytonema hofmannii PCC 7110 TaxID=128403 RepID=A0A139WZH3_9CYAN|nr:hypothetical protein [Scytonema hofmannii]KYC37849.1 hypothetical protein WA1_04905 [Scytonema hofmannii PCC 7110]
MALIEYLERGDWRGVLRRSFEGAITLLQTDRFRPTSSAVDDVKSWLTNGGVSRVQLQLDREMKGRRLEENHQREIRDFLEQLIQENQLSIVQLMANGIIPWNQADFLVTMGISESEFDAMLQQISTDTNPFETWMLANGYSQEIIDQIYEVIDSWLIKNGLRFPTHPTDHNLN